MMRWRSFGLAMLLVGTLLLSAVAILPMVSNAYAQPAGAPAPTGGGGGDAPKGTPATGDLKTKDASGNEKSCNDVPEAKGGKLLGKIVPCMVYTIQESTIKFTEKMVSTLKPLLYTFLLLVVVIFGARMLAQEPEVMKQGFLLLVKISIVAIILADLGNTAAYDGSGSQGKLIPAVYGIMSESQAIIAGAIDTTGLGCKTDGYLGPNTLKLWGMMDCVMGKLYGFTTGTDPNTGKESTNMLLVSSFFGLLSGFFFGGAWGVTIFLGMLGTLFTIFMMVVRVAVTFLTSYLYICLMLIMCPLLLPLAFLKITTSYFEATYRIILAGFITPVLITAYSMFALIIYDKVLFAPDSAVQSLFKYENIKDALQPDRPACSRPVTGNATEMRFGQTEPSAEALAKKFLSPLLQNNLVPTLTGANDACAPLKITNLDTTKIKGLVKGTGAADDPSRKKAFTKMFTELLSLFIIAYLLYRGLDLMSQIINQITGRRSATEASGALLDKANTDFAQRGKDAYEAALNQFKAPKESNATYKSGAEFLTGLPKDVSNAVKAATDELVRKR